MANPPREFGIAYGLGAAGGVTYTDKGTSGTVLVAGSDGRPSMTTVGTSGLTDDSVTFAKMQNITTDRLIGRDTASSGDPEEIALTNGLEFTGSTSIGIANDAVTFARMQNITTDRLIGRDTASTGDPEEIAVANGLEFTGSAGIGIANDGVTYARMQNVSAASRLLGRGSAGGAGDPEEITLGTGLSMSTTTLNNAARSIMQFSSGTSTVATGATVYLGVTADATEGPVRFPCPVAGNVVAMVSTADGFAGAGQAWTYTLAKFGVDTALTFSVSGASAFTGNTTGSIAVSLGDALTVKLVTSGGAAVAHHQVCIAIQAT